jgi:hypothetical protein
MSSGVNVLVPPKNVPQCRTVLDVAACAVRDCAAAGITWKASRRIVALRPAAAHLAIQRALLCVLGVRFTGSPPIVSGTALRQRKLTTLAVVSAESAAFTPC